MVVTLDRGVDDLRHYPPGSHAGIVVLRPTSQDPNTVIELVDRFLSNYRWTTRGSATWSSNRTASASDAPSSDGARAELSDPTTPRGEGVDSTRPKPRFCTRRRTRPARARGSGTPRNWTFAARWWTLPG